MKTSKKLAGKNGAGVSRRDLIKALAIAAAAAKSVGGEKATKPEPKAKKKRWIGHD